MGTIIKGMVGLGELQEIIVFICIAIQIAA